MREIGVLTMFCWSGVSPDRVQIISVTQIQPAGTREYRSQVPRGHTQVKVRVVGALRLKNLKQSLQRHGFPRITVKTGVSWDHHVSARAKPGKNVKIHGR